MLSDGRRHGAWVPRKPWQVMMSKQNAWYAVRLKSGASRPSKKNPNLTNIEFALTDANFSHYLPLDRKEIIHHRTKKPLDKTFPLLPGYCFVQDVRDWYELHRVDYVAGVLGIKGTPLKLHGADIENIRIAEGEIFQRYEAQKEKRRIEEEMKENHITQRRARVLYPAGSTVKINDAHMLLGGRNAIVKEATGRDTIKAYVETLNGLLNAELPLAMISRVA